MKDLHEESCINCGEAIWWDDTPDPRCLRGGCSDYERSKDSQDES